MYKTTVVIPNYNGCHFMKDCLPTLGDVPVIVVDNGSTDDSVSFLKENYPGVQLIENETNRGFCGASNQGIRAVTTPYVFLLNNDTKLEKDCISRLEECMEDNPAAFSVQAKMLQMAKPEIIDDAGDSYCALGWAYARWKGKPAERCTKREEIFASCGGAVLYRTEYLKITGVFDENHFAYLEDIDLGYRARIMGYKNLIEPTAIVYHVGSGATGSRYNAFKVNLSSRNSVYLFCKNMPMVQLILNLPLLLTGLLIKWLFFLKKGYGKNYFIGVCKGFALAYSEEGRRNHVTFRWKYLGNYFRIQWKLWVNMFRIIV